MTAKMKRAVERVENVNGEMTAENYPCISVNLERKPYISDRVRVDRVFGCFDLRKWDLKWDCDDDSPRTLRLKNKRQ